MTLTLLPILHSKKRISNKDHGRAIEKRKCFISTKPGFYELSVAFIFEVRALWY